MGEEPLRLAASVDTKPGADTKSKRVEILAYAGGIIFLNGWGNTVIDTAGLTFTATIPLLADHELSLNSIVGQGSPAVRKGQVFVSGIVSDATDAGSKVLKLAAQGFRWEASVGVAASKRERVEAGQTVTANGRTHTAPADGLVVVRAGRLFETSILPVAADSLSTVSIAARKAMTLDVQNPGSEDAMILAAGVKAVGEGVDPANWTMDQARAAAIAGERERVRLVNQYAGKRGDFSNSILEARRAELHEKALTGELSVTGLRAGMLQLAKDDAPQGPRPPSGRVDEMDSQVITAALCLTAGLPEDQVGQSFGDRSEQVMNAAIGNRFRGFGLHALMHHVIRAAGMHCEPGIRAGDTLLRTAFQASNQLKAGGYSTLSLPGILGDAQNKAMLTAFQAVETVGEKICGRTDNKDFKTFKRYRLTGSGTAQRYAPAGEIKHISLQEESYEGRITTDAAMIQLTREDMVNDDLNAFMQVPQILGRMAVLGREKAVFQTLLGATSAFFHETNFGNYFDGADSALSQTSLTEAVKLFRKQTDANGDPILVSPSILLVPPELEQTADKLLGESTVVVTVPGASGGPLTEPNRNPFAGKYKGMASPYLSNATYSGYSATAWYLFANPADVAAILLAYLNGQDQPMIEEGDVNFNTLGVAWRVVYDFGVCLGDYRGVVKSKGAA